MNSQENFFHLLKELFSEFQTAFHVPTPSGCGTCNYCCSGEMNFPSLFSLEEDYISNYLKIKSTDVTVEQFTEFLRLKNLPLCPFYSSHNGCGIYESRPIFCRIFGQVEQGNPVPHICVFKGLEKRFKYNDIKDFLLRYNQLNLNYIDYKLGLSMTEEEKLLLYKEKGRSLILLQKFKEAMEIFNIIAELKEEADSIYELAWCCTWSGFHEDGLKYFIKSLNLGIDKIHPSIYQDIAYSSMKLNMIDEAERFFNKALEVQPFDPMIHVGQYFIYELKGEKEKSHRKVREIEARFPEYSHMISPPS